MKVQSQALKSLQHNPEGHSSSSRGHFGLFSMFEVSPSIPHLIKDHFPKGDQFMKDSRTLCGFSAHSVAELNCFRSPQIPVNTSRPASVSRFSQVAETWLSQRRSIMGKTHCVSALSYITVSLSNHTDQQPAENWALQARVLISPALFLSAFFRSHRFVDFAVQHLQSLPVCVWEWCYRRGKLPVGRLARLWQEFIWCIS